MKKMFFLLSLIIILFISFYYNEDIVAFFVNLYVHQAEKTTVLVNNSYASSRNYQYIQLTDDFSPKNKQHLINIYYTILNSGMTEFTFFCPKEYGDCVSDVNDLSDDQGLLSSINNYVPVYNSFKNIETEFDTLGKVSIKIHPVYNETQKEEINRVVDQVEKTYLSPSMAQEEKIKAIHDYIINTTQYDKDRSDNKVKQYHSDTAYGALIEHQAICGGYSDAMKLFLDRMGIENYKISSENHIWNLVKVDNTWLHLDLTWDDPITDTGENVLEYSYFLITTEELQSLETDQHVYNKAVYPEAN
ncbi:MAG: hypothetical protein HFG40_01140 [Bacilli bacterium]|nr:hypothetical protein [Bacilli bacterium]